VIAIQKNLRARFDWFVLKPMWLFFIALAIYYFIQKEWLIGVLMIAMDFFLGMIAASLHKEKSFSELAGGYPTAKDIGEDTTVQKSEYRDMASAYMKLGFLVFVASFILCFHHGFRWYYCLGIAVLVGWLGPLLLLLPFVFLGVNASPQENSKEDS
jgi:hypothetical protein